MADNERLRKPQFPRRNPPTRPPPGVQKALHNFGVPDLRELINKKHQNQGDSPRDKVCKWTRLSFFFFPILDNQKCNRENASRYNYWYCFEISIEKANIYYSWVVSYPLVNSKHPEEVIFKRWHFIFLILKFSRWSTDVDLLKVLKPNLSMIWLYEQWSWG